MPASSRQINRQARRRGYGGDHGNPASQAFCTISNDTRPLTMRTAPGSASGSRLTPFCSSREPKTCRRRCGGRHLRRTRAASPSAAKNRRAVEAAGLLERRLAGAEAVGQLADHVHVDGPRDERRDVGGELVDRGAAADAARTVGDELPAVLEQSRHARRRVAREKDVDDVVRPGLIGMPAMLDGADIVGGSDDALREQETGRERAFIPGVRMITANDWPCSRTSSGSSAAAASVARSRRRADTRVTGTSAWA